MTEVTPSSVNADVFIGVSPETATPEPPEVVEVTREELLARRRELLDAMDLRTREGLRSIDFLLGWPPVPAAFPQPATTAEPPPSEDDMTRAGGLLLSLANSEEEISAVALVLNEIGRLNRAGSAVPAVPPDPPSAPDEPQFTPEQMHAALGAVSVAMNGNGEVAPVRSRDFYMYLIDEVLIALGFRSGVDSTTSQEEKP